MRFHRTILAVFLSSPLAHAAPEPPSKDDVARADQLFREAQQLSQKGQYAEACPKLAESQRLDPANGTILNLALCHESEGKTATAFKELTDLVAQLSTSKDDRQRAKLANEHLKALGTKLTRLTFDTSALPSGATLTLDGDPVVDPGASLPVDPGSHSVVARTAAKKSSTTVVESREPGVTKSVKLDALEDDAPPAAMAAPVAQPAPVELKPRSTSGQRVAGLVIGGVGLVGIGIGAGFGIRTFSLKSERNMHCTGTVCDAEGIRLHDDAKSSATISTVGFIVGAVALVTGTVLFLTGKPQTTKPSTEARFLVTPDGFAIRGL